MSVGFSVVLIARNEEKNLPRLLKSLEEFRTRGGEIILLDTGSTDATAQLARDNGVKVTEVGERFVTKISSALAKKINAKFIVKGEEPVVKAGAKLFDYAAARNYAATLASNDVIATPDCDEAYTTLDIDKIEDAIKEGVQQFEYDFVFAHFPDGKPAVQFMHCKFYDRRILQWEGIVHEVLIGTARKQYFGRDVIFLEHWQGEQEHRSRYPVGLALDCYQNPEKDRQSHYFGRELLWTGRYWSAIEELDRHINLGGWRAEAAHSMMFMGDAYMAVGNLQQALTCYHDAFLMDGTTRAPLMRLAQHFYANRDSQKTACYATAALQIPLNQFYGNYMADYTFLPHEMLYWALWELGDKQAAAEHWRLALAYSPTSEKYNADKVFFEVPQAVEIPKRNDQNFPTVAFIIPSLGREEGLQRCLDSLKKLDYPAEKIIINVDKGEGTVPEKVNRLLRNTPADYYVYASNDVEFTPISLYNAVVKAQHFNFGLVAFNTGEVLPDEGNICEHFLISKSLITQLGGVIFDEDFHHVGCDNLLWAKAVKLGQAIRCKDAVVKHHHFSKPGGVMDAVYQKGWQHCAEDRVLLATKLAQL